MIPQSKMKLSGSVISEIGNVRQTNEDSYFVDNVRQVYAVADGIGGLPCGEKASHCAINVLSRMLADQDHSEGQTHVSMASILMSMNESVSIIGNLLAKDTGIGTTFSLVRAIDGECELGHVGDSSIFLIDAHSIRSIVPEHVRQVVGPQVTVHKGESHQAVAPPVRKVLDRYVGKSASLKPMIATFRPQLGSRILICTDGISSVISEDEILAIHQARASCANFLEALAATAKTRGGPDNLTGISIRVGEESVGPV